MRELVYESSCGAFFGGVVHILPSHLEPMYVEVTRRFSGLGSWLDRRRTPVGIALSITAHLLLGLLLLLKQVGGGGSEQGLSGTGPAQAGDYGVEVVLMPSSAIQAAANESTALITDTVVDMTDVEALLSTAITEIASTPSTEASKDTADSDTNLKGQAAKAGAAGGGTGSTANDGDALWAAIEPCWRRRANADTLPVTLTVSFGADGKLSAVPVIERLDGAGIGPQFQVSETQAIQALAECGGYSMAAGQANVRINFPKL
ncbi:hypothetical protein [Asticcacaulis sp. YBE204]|uniref:hypothetical protein n=1 Tax=Asticcacaulis sp. YBE204 TaxID=1282363 RepID=UPI0012DD3E58|nr:hypothetical protein [Asticcacaulis sp. YBE204]